MFHISTITTFQVVTFAPELYGDEVKLIHVTKEMADGLDEGNLK